MTYRQGVSVPLLSEQVSSQLLQSLWSQVYRKRVWRQSAVVVA